MLKLCLASALLLAGCAAPGPLSAQRQAQASQEVSGIGAHPAGILSTFPPTDPSFNGLRCTGGGQNTTECSRPD